MQVIKPVLFKLFREVIEQGYGNRQIFREVLHHCVLQQSFEEGLEVFQQYREQYRSKAADLALGGTLYAGKKNYLEAINLFQQAIYLRPQQGPFYYQRALAYVELSEFALALDDLNAAIHYQGYFPQAHTLLRTDPLKTRKSGKGLGRFTAHHTGYLQRSKVVTLHEFLLRGNRTVQKKRWTI